MDDSLKILGLDKKETCVLYAIREGVQTPLAISRQTKLSRPGVYHILKRLHKRGIIEKGKYTHAGKWFLTDMHTIDSLLQKSAEFLTRGNTGITHQLKRKNGTFVVHQGRKAVREVISTIFDNQTAGRVYIFQGTVAREDWNKFFTPEETDALNQKIRDKGLIMDAIYPSGWIEHEFNEFGVAWAQAYEGRTARTCVIDQAYFSHRATLFMFKNSVYLFTLHEEIVVEIQNSDIQKMILALFSAVSDTAKTIDINARLRELIDQKAP